MCTTIGFSYEKGQVFGRTLEVGMALPNKILFVPKNKAMIQAKDQKYSSKYNTLGSGFFDIVSFGDGINEKGLMGSNNLFPAYASYAQEAIAGKINLTVSDAFDYLLTRCQDVAEVKKEASKMIILEKIDDNQSGAHHFFFMDAKGEKVVLEPKAGELIVYDNPYGVLTNSPEFPWHVTNLRNYLHLQAENISEKEINGEKLAPFGEGTGMAGLPGDFTPPARFIRAAYYVSQTPHYQESEAAILQGFRILSQFDIPEGAIVDPIEGHRDETLYTSIMNTDHQAYYIKTHTNIHLQSFYLKDFKEETDIQLIELKKSMDL